MCFLLVVFFIIPFWNLHKIFYTPELVRSLDELATEDQEVFTHQVPTKAVNEARKQLREYNRIHQVKEVNPL